MVKSCSFNSNIFVSGGRDGMLYLWDLRSESNLLISKSEPEIGSFTGASFYKDEKTIISVQASDNEIKVWDIRKLDGYEADLR